MYPARKGTIGSGSGGVYHAASWGERIVSLTVIMQCEDVVKKK